MCECVCTSLHPEDCVYEWVWSLTTVSVNASQTLKVTGVKSNSDFVLLNCCLTVGKLLLPRLCVCICVSVCVQVCVCVWSLISSYPTPWWSQHAQSYSKSSPEVWTSCFSVRPAVDIKAEAHSHSALWRLVFITHTLPVSHIHTHSSLVFFFFLLLSEEHSHGGHDTPSGSFCSNTLTHTQAEEYGLWLLH